MQLGLLQVIRRPLKTHPLDNAYKRMSFQPASKNR